MPHLEPIHPRPPQHEMPFVPGIKVRHTGTLLFVSGATANPLYHAHPHDPAELTPPDDLREQTRRVMDNLKLVLDAAVSGDSTVRSAPSHRPRGAQRPGLFFVHRRDAPSR